MTLLNNEATPFTPNASGTSGQSLVSTPSPLTRLNYFDGKFLRADDLRREQEYLRQLVQLSNHGLGAGIVYGMDTVLDSKGQLSVGAGLAMDSNGRTLLISSPAALDLSALINATRRITTRANTSTNGSASFVNCIDVTAAPGDLPTQGSSLYVICIGHAESLCGTEDVYGRLCEEACVTATDRPLIVEGVVVRALPVTLQTPLARSKAVALDRRHLRSLIASAFYEDERHVVGSLISRAGLMLDTWCAGADLASVGCVPLAVVARSGTQTVFLDAWTARRERIEAPAKRYWAWRMAMRPWDVFLAQVLQFQCQLHDVLTGGGDGGSGDPCTSQQTVLAEAARYLRDFDQSYARHVAALSTVSALPTRLQTSEAMFQPSGGVADLTRLRRQIDVALQKVIAGPSSRVLINGGIVELPSAGYLPVVLGTESVNTQVRRLLGEGLDLRYCVVRPDFVPHALEEAQHMERISLLSGLDDPKALQDVDVLVPNGTIVSVDPPALVGFDTQVELGANRLSAPKSTTGGSTGGTTPPLVLHGAGRGERLVTGGGAFYFAGAQETTVANHIVGALDGLRAYAAATEKKRATMMAAASLGQTAGFTREPLLDTSLLMRFQQHAAFATSAKAGDASLATAAPAVTPVSLWSSMRAERDPFILNTADAATASFELVLATSRTNAAGVLLHLLVRLRIAGSFSITQASISIPGGARLVGHLSGTLTTQVMAEATASDNNANPFEADIVITRTGTVASGAMQARIMVPNSKLEMVTDVKWDGTPLEAKVALSLIGPSTQLANSSLATQNIVALLRASAVTSTDALREGSTLRLLSTSALNLIGAEMTRANQGGTAYEDTALRQLFPPAPPPSDDLLVLPTLDWVLFHRRRTKVCGTPTQSPAPSPVRRYQLYLYAAESVRQVALVRKALQSAPESLAFLPIRRVDVVEFAGGLTSLITASDALIADWQVQKPGNSLVYGAIATTVASDASLSNTRLSNVAQGISKVSMIDLQQSIFEVLPTMPSPLVVPGTDGIILLATVQAVTSTCQEVYRVELNGDTASMLKNDQVAKLLSLSTLTTRLGTVRFDVGGSTPTPDDLTALVTAWKAAGNGTPNTIKIYPNPSDSTATSDLLLTARTLSMLPALGGSSSQFLSVGTMAATDWPSAAACPIITLLGSSSAYTVLAVATRFSLAVTHVVPPVNIPLPQDVLTFHDVALADAPDAQAIGQTIAPNGGANTGIRSIAVSYVTPDTIDDLAKQRSAALFAAVGLNTTAFAVQNLGPRNIATDAEKALLTRNGQSFNALLLISVTV